MKNLKKLSKRKGFTLVELVLIIVLLSTTLGAVLTFANHTIKLGDVHQNEVNFQADMRDTMLTIDERVKKSSAVFAITKDEFMDSSGKPFMDPEWSYIGISQSEENKGQVCVFNYVDGKWQENLLSSGNSDIEFELTFDKETEEGTGQKMLTYTLIGKEKGGDVRSLDAKTEVLSAYTVVDKGTKKDKAVALAFRTGERVFPEPSSVTFVIDVSGSMTNPMKTTDEFGNKITLARYEVVNKALKDMLSSLVDTTSVDVAFVDFGSYAMSYDYSDPSAVDQYINLNTKYGEVATVIDKIHPGAVHWTTRNTGTNVGDGMRLAYNMLEKRNVGLKKRNTRFNYVVLLMDGLPNQYTLRKGFMGAGSYYTGEKRITSNRPRNFRIPYDWSSRGGLNYSKYIISYFLDRSKNSNQALNKIPNMKQFIVTIGAFDGYAKNNVKEINAAMKNNDSAVFEGSDGKAIKEAVDRIAEDLTYNVWSYSGPRPQR